MILDTTIIEEGAAINSVSLESRLLKERIIVIDDEISQKSCNKYKMQLIYLISKIGKYDKERNPITIYIDSYGGDIYPMLGLYDIIRNYVDKGYIIKTIASGVAASAAAIILLSGTKGHRMSLKHSTILLHQPSSQTGGTVSDMSISLKECERLKALLSDIIKEHTNDNISGLDIERDAWLTPEDALNFGIIDKII